jgi:hypothetical protein
MITPLISSIMLHQLKGRIFWDTKSGCALEVREGLAFAFSCDFDRDQTIIQNEAR